MTPVRLHPRDRERQRNAKRIEWKKAIIQKGDKQHWAVRSNREMWTLNR
jgi:hypothetical protein